VGIRRKPEQLGQFPKEANLRLGREPGNGSGSGIRRAALLLARRGKNPSVLDEEVLEALADETAGAILRESARLPKREKEIVLGIVGQFGSQIDDA
jgi:hypothetical protein